MSSFNPERNLGIMQNMAEKPGLAVLAATATLAGGVALAKFDSLRDKIIGSGNAALVETSDVLLGAEASAQTPSYEYPKPVEYAPYYVERCNRSSLSGPAKVTGRFSTPKKTTFKMGVNIQRYYDCDTDTNDGADVGDKTFYLYQEAKKPGSKVYTRVMGTTVKLPDLSNGNISKSVKTNVCTSKTYSRTISNGTVRKPQVRAVAEVKWDVNPGAEQAGGKDGSRKFPSPSVSC